jgi:hypothetical protein
MLAGDGSSRRKLTPVEYSRVEIDIRNRTFSASTEITANSDTSRLVGMTTSSITLITNRQ